MDLIDALVQAIVFAGALSLMLGIPLLFILWDRKEERSLKASFSAVARDYDGSVVESLRTVFNARECTFHYGKRFIMLSRGYPFTDRSMAVSSWDYRLGGKFQNPLIYVSHSCPQELKANIYYIENEATAKQISDKYRLSEPIAYDILALKEGNLYLRKGFLIYSVCRDSPGKDLLKNKVEKLIALAEELDECKPPEKEKGR